jgi:hypothetical protein
MLSVEGQQFEVKSPSTGNYTVPTGHGIRNILTIINKETSHDGNKTGQKKIYNFNS